MGKPETADFVPNGGAFKHALGEFEDQKAIESASIGGKKRKKKNKTPKMNWNGGPPMKKIRTSFTRQGTEQDGGPWKHVGPIGL